MLFLLNLNISLFLYLKNTHTIFYLLTVILPIELAVQGQLIWSINKKYIVYLVLFLLAMSNFFFYINFHFSIRVCFLFLFFFLIPYSPFFSTISSVFSFSNLCTIYILNFFLLRFSFPFHLRIPHKFHYIFFSNL